MSFTACDAIDISFFVFACATHHERLTSKSTKPFFDPFLNPSHSCGSFGAFFRGGQFLRPSRLLGNIDVYQDRHSKPYVSMLSMCGGTAASPEVLAHFMMVPGRNLESSSPLQAFCWLASSVCNQIILRIRQTSLTSQHCCSITHVSTISSHAAPFTICFKTFAIAITHSLLHVTSTRSLLTALDPPTSTKLAAGSVEAGMSTTMLLVVPSLVST